MSPASTVHRFASLIGKRGDTEPFSHNRQHLQRTRKIRMNTELATLKADLDAMKTQLIEAQQELRQTRQQNLETVAQQKRTMRRGRMLGGLGLMALIGGFALAGRLPVSADGGGSGPTLASLQQQVNVQQTQINSQ